MSTPDVSQVPVFAALKARDREVVLANATHRTYAKGARLIEEGERAVDLYFIVSGSVGVATAREGERPLLGPGDFFGELGLLGGHPRSATLVATEDVTVIILSASEFRSLLERYPAMAVPMVFALVARLHRVMPHEHADHHDDASGD